MKRAVVGFVLVAIATCSVQKVLAEEAAVEEVLSVGLRRDGDYTFITEDTQKLVETAGSLGDPLGAIYSLPGVVYSGDNGQDPAVRGSSPNDNTFVVDFLPASYIFHEFGVSIFSEFILRDFQMYSAGFGPEYGAATGAVFDVSLRQPRQQDWTTTIDFSMLRSGIFMESRVTESSAFYLSARRSLIDLFLQGDDVSDEGIEVTKVPRDTDYQFKYTWQASDTNRLSISANGAEDEAEAELTVESEIARSNPDFEGDAGLRSRYQGQSVLWELGSAGDSLLKVAAGRLSDQTRWFWGDDYRINLQLDQNTFKSEYSLPFTERSRTTLGVQHSAFSYQYNIDQILFVCTEFDPDCELRRGERVRDEREIDFVEQTAYINNRWQATDAFSLDLGLQYQRNDYNKQQFTHPRIALAYALASGWTLSSKAGSYNRFPDIDTALPVIGNPSIRSPQSQHYTLGLAKEWPRDWSLSVEMYYKTFSDLPLALREGDVDVDLLYASDTEGRAHGVDIVINKNMTDRWYGWLALSYGRSERSNERTGETKNYFLDTPFIANWVMNYQFTSKFNMGWRWSIRSGAAYTPIVGIQENPYFEDSVLPVYGEAYTERLPLYNRLDLRFKWDFSSFGHDSALIVDVINALNVRNVSAKTLDYDKVNSTDDELAIKEQAGIGIVPALTYRLSF